MSALDDILDGAKFDGDDERPSTDEAKPAKENLTFKQLRDHARSLERETKKYEKELEELRAFRDKVTTEKRAAQLTAAGLSPRQSEAFSKLYDEASEDNIKAFKAEVLGVGEVDDNDAPFTPAPTGGEAPRKTYTREEFESIMRTDPTRGRAIMAANLVVWQKDTTAGPT